MFAVSRIEAYVKTLVVQGILLFLIILFDIQKLDFLNFLFLVIETLIVKSIGIPYLLLKVIRRNEINREIESYLSQFYSLLLGSIIFILGFFATFWAMKIQSGIKPLYFGMSIVLIISSLFLIVNRKTIITHILCYMVLENGIFLLSLSVANELPLLVNLGVLLDLFIGVYLFVLLFNKIQEMFDGSHVDVLTELKD